MEKDVSRWRSHSSLQGRRSSFIPPNGNQGVVTTHREGVKRRGKNQEMKSPTGLPWDSTKVEKKKVRDRTSSSYL